MVGHAGLMQTDATGSGWPWRSPVSWAWSPGQARGRA